MTRTKNPDIRSANMKAIGEMYADGDDIVAALFRDAVTLDIDIRSLYARRTANRSSLRNLAAGGHADPDHVAAIYPDKAAPDAPAES